MVWRLGVIRCEVIILECYEWSERTTTLDMHHNRTSTVQLLLDRHLPSFKFTKESHPKNIF